LIVRGLQTGTSSWRVRDFNHDHHVGAMIQDGEWVGIKKH
jgi:hypothetical protein